MNSPLIVELTVGVSMRTRSVGVSTVTVSVSPRLERRRDLGLIAEQTHLGVRHLLESTSHRHGALPTFMFGSMRPAVAHRRLRRRSFYSSP
jgi:hypothetical protein